MNSFTKDNTNAMQGIAIILMYIHHCFRVKNCYEEFNVVFWPLSEHATVLLAGFAKICVGIFVFLSAYGMTISYKDKVTKEFYTKREKIVSVTLQRYISLIMGFLFVFLLSQLLAFAGRNQIDVYGNTKSSLIYFFIDALGMAAMYQTPTFNNTWWYMSLAVVLIFIMPLLLEIYKKVGGLIIPIFIVLPRSLRIESFTLNCDLSRWLLAIVLGIWFADKNILVKLKEKTIFKSRPLKFLTATLLLFGLCAMRAKIVFARDFYDILDGIVPVFLIYYCYDFLLDFQWLNKILVAIGKYSMNMFLIHSFVRWYYFAEFSYSFRYPWLIVFVLLIDTWIISVLIEKVKDISGYNHFILKIKSITNKYLVKE